MQVRTVFLGLLAAVVIITALIIGGDRPDPSAPPDVSTPGGKSGPALNLSVADTLSRGESLYASLVSLGVDRPQVHRVLAALGEEVNLRSCKPGDSYSAELDSAGSVRSLAYRKGRREIYLVERDSSGYCVAREEVSVSGVSRRIEGELATSLWEAFLDLGESPQVALKLADVFAWEIDFVTEPRVGDTFVIIFDELYCGGERIGVGDVFGALYVNQGEEHLAFGFPDEDGRMQHYDYDGNSVQRVFLKSPLNYRRISSHFSNRRFHPILKIYRPHHGVDYAAPTGTPVVSIGDGRVVKAAWNGGFGKYVEIRHNTIYTSCYGHLSGYGKGVRRGAGVSQGQVIGYVGSTGLSTGPHLDFRIKKYKSYVNPLTIDYPRGDPIDESKREAYFARRDAILKALRAGPLASAESGEEARR
jgi:murein DD-endopeptidase MepM/ murein hydrolase activator NlpD